MRLQMPWETTCVQIGIEIGKAIKCSFALQRQMSSWNVPHRVKNITFQANENFKNLKIEILCNALNVGIAFLYSFLSNQNRLFVFFFTLINNETEFNVDELFLFNILSTHSSFVHMHLRLFIFSFCLFMWFSPI